MDGKNVLFLKKENRRLNEELVVLRKKLSEEELKSEKLSHKVIIEEKTIDGLKKELLLLQRRQSCDRSVVKSADEINDVSHECVSCKRLNEELSDEKGNVMELKGTVGKLNRLIGILKRKIVLLEAGVCLSITKRDVESLLGLLEE